MTTPTRGDDRPTLTVMTGGAASRSGEASTVIRTVPGGPTIVVHSDDGYRHCTVLIAQHGAPCRLAVLLGGAVILDDGPLVEPESIPAAPRRPACRCGRRHGARVRGQ